MKLICIGDSLTFGFGVSRGQRWTTRVQELTGAQVLNEGINGDTTGGMLCRLSGLLRSERLSETVIMIMGGANDIFYSGTSQHARANIAAMAQQTLASGACPLIGIVPPISADFCPEQWSEAVDFAAAEKELAEYCAWLRNFCTAFGIEYADLAVPLTDAAGAPKRALFSDGLHPTAEGHELIARALAKKIAELEKKYYG